MAHSSPSFDKVDAPPASPIVYFDYTEPFSATVFDSANPPVTDNPALHLDPTKLYVGTDGTLWTSDGVTYTSAEVDTLDSVTTRGNTTANNIQTSGQFIAFRPFTSIETARVADGGSGSGLIRVNTTFDASGVNIEPVRFQYRIPAGIASSIQWDNITSPRNMQLPDASGTFALSVNGVSADTAGNIVLPMTASGATVGDIKHGLQAADHSGWLLLNGRLKSTLTATQQAAATALGIGANLPNALDRLLKKKAGALLTTGGSNTTTIAQANLPAVNLTAASAGNHTHTISASNAPIGQGGGGPGMAGGGNYAPTGYSSFSASTTGAHTHTVPLGGSGTALATEDAWLNVNVFLYLGT